MAKIEGKKEPIVAEIEDSEFELMFAEAGTEDPDLSKLEKTPEELEAEKKAAEEEAAKKVADEGKTPEELEAEKKVAEEAEAAKKAEEAKTPEELAAEKKAIEDADAAKVASDAKAEEKRVADAKVATEAQAKRDEEAKVAKDDRDKRATLADDEKELEAAVGKDFPDVKKVMEIQQRIMEAKNEIRMTEFQDNLIKQLAPTMQTVQAVATDSWERAVFDKHPDTVELLPEVEKWVLTQPKIVQASYNTVLDKGTPAETIELMDTFKASTGRNEDPAKVAEEKAAADKLAEEEAAKEKKLKSQEGVRGRSAPKKETEPTDFEGAFNSVKAVA